MSGAAASHLCFWGLILGSTCLRAASVVVAESPLSQRLYVPGAARREEGKGPPANSPARYVSCRSCASGNIQGTQLATVHKQHAGALYNRQLVLFQDVRVPKANAGSL